MRKGLLLLVAASLPMGGCASMRAMQQPVRAKDLGHSVCPSGAQIREATGTVRPADERAAFRDGVISDCVKAIDARYLTFKAQLHTEASGTRLTTAVAATGAAAIGTFARADIARRLAAGSAFALGTSAAVDKNVFFDQALPALEAAMDARRDVVLKRIVEAQKADRLAETYTLVGAGYDLDAYQQAGNLYGAVADLTRGAVQKAQEAARELGEAQARPLGGYNPPELGVSERYDKLYAKIRAYRAPADEQKLKAAMDAMKVVVSEQASFDARKAALIGDIKRREIGPPDTQVVEAIKLEGIIK